MTSKLLLAAAAIGLMIPGVAAAQDANAGNRMELGVEDVSPDDPFGDIDVAAAQDDIGGWAGTLDANQRLELTERCRVIGENGLGYDDAAQDFCTAYIQWDGANPVQR